MTFQVIDKASGQGVQPHQTFLRFYDEKTGEEGIKPVLVTNGGKAKFELVGVLPALKYLWVLNYCLIQNMAKPPLSIPPTASAPLKVTLILGSPSHSPLKVELFDLHIPASHPAPQHPDEASYHPLPLIEHTFRPDQKLPPKPVSAIFTGLTFAPWVVLLGLVSRLSKSLGITSNSIVLSGPPFHPAYHGCFLPRFYRSR